MTSVTRVVPRVLGPVFQSGHARKAIYRRTGLTDEMEAMRAKPVADTPDVARTTTTTTTTRAGPYVSPSKALLWMIQRHKPVPFIRIQKMVFERKQRDPDGPFKRVDDRYKLKKILNDMRRRGKIYVVTPKAPPPHMTSDMMTEEYLAHFMPVDK
ncbi:H15 domain-containing protein [Plasmodiophora brassicae]|uniref:Uncharacterized protein n=1 Tax=Plasmodiophora brassicae TaxID=37360 RepID=A0A0G4IKS7_PLABS|nr:hypothetical protein PBRA_004405 [Plasmodiophora brassicae]